MDAIALRPLGCDALDAGAVAAYEEEIRVFRLGLVEAREGGV